MHSRLCYIIKKAFFMSMNNMTFKINKRARHSGSYLSSLKLEIGRVKPRQIVSETPFQYIR
jgi:hypothetical protein